MAVNHNIRNFLGKSHTKVDQGLPIRLTEGLQTAVEFNP